jgi:DNA-directed RNA polymerase subunit beta
MTSRKLVFSELYEASKIVKKYKKNPWVLETEYPVKSRIFDGRQQNPSNSLCNRGSPI